MRRIYEDNAYGPGPVADCYWDSTVARPISDQPLTGEAVAEVAILGAGFTGLSAALHLARDHGADAAVVEAHEIGWGASGRNGGFVCLGGAKASDAAIARRFGQDGLSGWNTAQRRSVELVAEILQRHEIEADTHSNGEVVLAHRPRDFAALRREALDIGLAHGTTVEVYHKDDLASAGLAGPGFHGAIRTPIGFALNPLKYVIGLAKAAREAGARIYPQSPVTRIERKGGDYVLRTASGQLRARKLIVATNGYSSEDLPRWMRARYLPVQSNILVTRELTKAEIAAQGWWSDHMAYDTRTLLHYFRLMPNRRFLFGMRGGVSASVAAQDEMKRGIRKDFEAMFPAWAKVETPWFWSGLACIARDLTPYAGPIRGWDGAFAGFAWHGNGVAMGSYAGQLLAGMAMGMATGQENVPRIFTAEPRRFPLGRWRRSLLPPAYGWYGFKDRG